MTLKVPAGFQWPVRPAQPADEADWRRLWQSYCKFYATSISPEITDLLWRRILDPGSPIHALVAPVAAASGTGGGLAGIANYVLHPYTWGAGELCYLEDLFVAEDARGRGAGSALIGTLAGMAQEKRWPRVYWHTHRLNEVARSLYDKITPPDPFIRYVVRVD